MKEFRQNLLWLRKKHKLSQEKFANLFDLTRANIDSYETKNTIISVENANKICNYFEITLDQFFNSVLDDSNFKSDQVRAVSDNSDIVITELKRDKEDLRLTIKELRATVKKLEEELSNKMKEIVVLQNKMPVDPLTKKQKNSQL